MPAIDNQTPINNDFLVGNSPDSPTEGNTMLNIQYLETGDATVAAGLFIPVANLPGLTAAELAAGATGRESKVGYSLLNALLAGVPTTALGLTVAKGNPQGAGTDIWNQTFTISCQKYADLAAGTVNVLPVPSAGTNAGVGDFAYTDLFAGATAVAAAATPGAGINIPHSSLSPYGFSGNGSETDARDWVNALLMHLATDSVLRNATDASALIARSRSGITGGAIPGTYNQATNPLTNLAAAEAGKQALITATYSFTYQLVADQSNQTFDVRHVTA